MAPSGMYTAIARDALGSGASLSAHKGVVSEFAKFLQQRIETNTKNMHDSKELRIAVRTALRDVLEYYTPVIHLSIDMDEEEKDHIFYDYINDNDTIMSMIDELVDSLKKKTAPKKSAAKKTAPKKTAPKKKTPKKAAKKKAVKK